MLKLSDFSKKNSGLSSLSVISRLTKLHAEFIQDVYNAWEGHRFTAMYI
jgi:hypothetical protein